MYETDEQEIFSSGFMSLHVGSVFNTYIIQTLAMFQWCSHCYCRLWLLLFISAVVQALVALLS